MISFRVHGTPAPQGSKRHVGNGIMIESSAKVKPWRQDVKYAALQAHSECCGDTGVHFPNHQAVVVTAMFYLQRPQSHYRSGAHSGELKPAAPNWAPKRPDIDKLTRSTLDALGEAGIWADDAQVCRLHATKRYVNAGETPGALLEIGPLE